MTCLTYRAQQRHGLTAEDKEYWKSSRGITRRVDSLAQVFTYGVYNGAVKVIGDTKGVQWMAWEIAPDDNVCPICLDNRFSKGDKNFRGWYRSGWFTPAMPAHPGCRCQWVLYWV